MPETGWQINALGSHDGGRDLSTEHCPEEELRVRQKIVLALTFRGTALIYYGNEIGMTDLTLDDPAMFQDELARRVYKAEQEIGTSPQEALRRAASFSRDRSRSPMPSAMAPHGGFTLPGAQPWLPVNPNYLSGINVADQQADPHSRWNFVRQLLQLRRENPALIQGTYEPIDPQSQEYIAFKRSDPVSGQTMLVAVNMSSKQAIFESLPETHVMLFVPS
jgi:glycosidase